ncbi:MAG: hypothetical protein ACRDWD_17005 [Acidimicrobiia bacterium]
MQLEDTRALKDPQITWHQACFDVADGEALVVEFTPPDCDYWMIALHNFWMETLDYRCDQCVLNSAGAAVAANGAVRCVIAAWDPGVPSWLDTAGHPHGVVGVRWVGDHVTDVLPDTRVVAIADLAR